MKIEYRVGMYIFGILVVILMSVYTGDLLYLTRIPAVAPFGFGIMIFFILLDAFLTVCGGKSPQLNTNVGHWSINTTKDIFDIPWQVQENADDKAKNIKLLQMRICLAGGIDWWGISIRSTSECPVVIAPSIYFHKEEKNYVCYANLEKYEIDELPVYIQYVVKRMFTGRIEAKTPIYYSEVSHMDGTATPENMRMLTLQKESNKEDSVIYKRMIRLYDELERGDKHKRKIFFKKELEEVKDEEDTK